VIRAPRFVDKPSAKPLHRLDGWPRWIAPFPNDGQNLDRKLDQQLDWHSI
jgi:hypothetical protein